MSTNIETRLRSTWGRLAFTLVWVALLSAAWPALKSSAPLRAIAGWGARHEFMTSLLLTALAYLTAIILILWIGVAVYLVATHQFTLKNLLRGFAALCLILLVAQGILSFVRAAALSSAAEYILTWLPMYIALYFALKFALPSTRRLPITRAAAN